MSDRNRQISRELSRLALSNQEENFHPRSYDEDLFQYEFRKKGNINETRRFGRKMFEGATTGSFSDDPVKNYKYLFISSVTLVCQFCIEEGMDSETAFNLSDLYIRQTDHCTGVSEIFDLHDKMFEDYASHMRQLGRAPFFSKPVLKCMDYIRQHLHDHLTAKVLSIQVGVSPAYLSTLFSSETGTSLSDYIREQRIGAAKLLLQYSEFTIAEISEYLSFSSVGHFSKLFRKNTGLSPKQYRKRTHLQSRDS